LTIESGNIQRIRSFLKAFGATDASLKNIELGLFGPQERIVKDASALSSLIDRLRSTRYAQGLPYEKGSWPISHSHWVWAIEGNGCGEMIDVLLASGAIPLAEHGTKLLGDAIYLHEFERVKLLTKAGVPVSGEESYFLLKGLPPIYWTDYLLKLGLTSILPLNWSILVVKFTIAEAILDAGASVNEVEPVFGYAPIHFAAMANLLETIKLLHERGANLEALDFQGRNILQLWTDLETKESLEQYIWNSKHPQPLEEVNKGLGFRFRNSGTRSRQKP
jgi:hypothetical protein